MFSYACHKLLIYCVHSVKCAGTYWQLFRHYIQIGYHRKFLYNLVKEVFRISS
jgi:hypothetical protein